MEEKEFWEKVEKTLEFLERYKEPTERLFEELKKKRC